MKMHRVRICFYLVIMICFLVAPLSFQAWAEEGSKKVDGQQEQASAQNQPRISFDANKFNAGEVWEGEQVVHDFTVKNTGTAELNISKVKAG